jgi:hypothetical protein
MPEFTIHLDDPQDAIENLRRAGGMGLAAQIEAQMPKAPVDEPTGDAIVLLTTHWPPFIKEDEGPWTTHDGFEFGTWDELLAYFPRGEFIVYRREPAPSAAEAVEADEDTCICSGRILPFSEIDPECPEHGTKPEPSPVQVEAGPVADLAGALRQTIDEARTRRLAAEAHDPIEAMVDAFWDEAEKAGKETPDGRALVLTRTFLDDLVEQVAARVLEVGGQRALTKAAAAARKEAADSRTNNGRCESEGLADWLDEYAKTVAS